MRKVLKTILILFVLGGCSLLACLLLLRGSTTKKEKFTRREVSSQQKEQFVKPAKIINDLPSKEETSKRKDCQFGFDFLEDLLEKQTAVSHYLLPSHKRQNFSGALVSQDLMCLDTMDAVENQWIGIFECHGQGRNQAVTFTTDGTILGGSSKILCLAMKNMVSKNVVLKKCNSNDETQKWTTDSKYGYIMPIVRQDHCLNSPAQEDKGMTIEPCNLQMITQKWQLVMQEVLSLWLDGAQRDFRIHQIKKKGTRKQMNKLMLQHKPSEKIKYTDSLFFR